MKRHFVKGHYRGSGKPSLVDFGSRTVTSFNRKSKSLDFKDGGKTVHSMKLSTTPKTKDDLRKILATVPKSTKADIRGKTKYK